MQMIFQDPYASLNPRMTLGDIVGEPLAVHKLAPARKETRRARRGSCSSSVGPQRPTTLNRYPHEFSGGQRQRIGIARALAVEPELHRLRRAGIALDVSIQAQIINLLEELQAELGLTYLFIAHDLSRRAAHLRPRGRDVPRPHRRAGRQRRRSTAMPLHPYTQALLSRGADPRPRGRGTARAIVLSGDVPSPVDPPSGCHFHTRCPVMQVGLCDVDDPPLVEVRSAHWAACHLISTTTYPRYRYRGDVEPERLPERRWRASPTEATPDGRRAVRRPQQRRAPRRPTYVAEDCGRCAGGRGAISPRRLVARRGHHRAPRHLGGGVAALPQGQVRRCRSVVIGILIFVAIAAPWIAPHNPTTQYDEGLTMKGMPVGSSAKFLLGTDTLGRDLLSRLMYGARVSLSSASWPTAWR